MRDYAAHRRIERRRDVDERVFVLEDGLDEVVHEVSVRAAVTARIDGLRKRGLEKVELIDDRLRFRDGAVEFVALAIRGELPSRAADFAAPAGRVEADHDSRHAARRSAEKPDFRPVAVAVSVVFWLTEEVNARLAHRGNFGQRPERHARVVRGGVRRIPHDGHPDAPVVVTRRGDGRVVEILPFRIDDFAEAPGVVDDARRVDVVVIRARLKHAVMESGLFDRFVEFVRLFRGSAPKRGDARRDVFAVFQRENGVIRVMRRVGCEEDRFDRFVFNHLLKGRILLLAAARFRETVAAVGKKIRHGDDFDVRVILKSELRAELARAVARDSDAKLAIRKGTPFGRLIDLRLRVVEPLNLGFLLTESEFRSQRGADGARQPGAKKRSSIDVIH